MRREDWNKGLGEIDPELVEEYIEQKAKHAKKSGRRPLIRAVIVAACVCLVIAAVVALPIALRYGSERWLDIPEESTSGSGGDVGSEQSTSDTADEPKKPVEYVSSWVITYSGNDKYMKISDDYQVSADHNGDVKNFKGIKFYTLDDFRGTVVNKKRKLSKQELDDIATFFDRGEKGIPIVDFNDMYVPKLDGAWTLLEEMIWWNGLDYEFRLENSVKDVTMGVRIMPMSDFERLMSRDDISRSIIDENKVIHVAEHSDSTVLYIAQGQSFCVCTIDAADLLDDEELKSIGIRKNSAIRWMSCYWDGYVGFQDIINIELTDAVRKELSALSETGEVVGRVSDKEIELDSFTRVPMNVGEAEVGTKWMHVDGVTYRISPDFDQICIVEDIYSAGRVLTLTESFKTAVNNATRYPKCYYSGRFEDGTLTVEHLYDGLDLVDVKVKEIIIGGDGEDYDTKNNKIIVELSSRIPCEYDLDVDSRYSDDHFLDGSEKAVHLDYEPVTVEMDFVGGATNRYFLYVNVGYTTVKITVTP